MKMGAKPDERLVGLLDEVSFDWSNKTTTSFSVADSSRNTVTTLPILSHD